MQIWQIEYIIFANDQTKSEDDRRLKIMLDYLGSYTDPKRAADEMKSSLNDQSDESTTIVYENKGFGKEPTPIVKMESEEEKERFLTEFEKAMKLTFGESYNDTKVTTPSRSHDLEVKNEDDLPDEIIAR